MVESRFQMLFKETVVHGAAEMSFRWDSSYADLTRLGKLDFPRFNGDKIKEWLWEAEQFFLIDRTPEELKVFIASIHFDGLAATLHQSIVQSMWWKHVRLDWWGYKLLFQARYNKHVGDSIEKLKLLQETEGIEEYHARFELISIEVELAEDYLVDIYLAGLRKDTQTNVKMFQPKSIQQCLVMGRLYEKVQAHQKREVVKKKSDDSKKVSQSPNVSSTVEGASLNNSPVHHYLPTDKESSKEKQSLQHEVSVDVESLLQQKLETKTLNQDKHELCVSPGDLPNVSQSFNVPCESMSRLKCWKFKFKPEIVAIKQQHNQVLSFLEPSSSCHKVAMVVVDDLSSDLSVMAGNGRELTVFQVEWSVKEEFVNKLQTELDISVRDEISEEKFFTHSHQAEHVWEPGGLSAKENQWDWQKQGSIVQGRYELQKQTLQDLQQFTFGDEQFQIKHKWRTECARHRLRHRQKKGKGSKSWNFKFKLEKKNIQHHHNQIRPASQDFFKRNLRGYQGDRVQWMFQQSLMMQEEPALETLQRHKLLVFLIKSLCVQFAVETEEGINTDKMSKDHKQQGGKLSAVTFSWVAATLQSISEDAHIQRRCRMWLRQTLQDLQQFIHGEVTDQIKHKWRFKLLHIVSELVFNLESVAISPAKYLVQKPLVKVAGKCKVELQQMIMALNIHMHFGIASHYVWHRCKAPSSQNFDGQVWDPGGSVSIIFDSN